MVIVGYTTVVKGSHKAEGISETLATNWALAVTASRVEMKFMR